jgi:hypothetical protein
MNRLVRDFAHFLSISPNASSNAGFWSIIAECVKKDPFTALYQSPAINLNILVHTRSRVARFFTVQHTKTGKKIPKWPQNVPTCQKIYLLAANMYTKWPQNIPTSSITRPSKIYPNVIWKYTIWQPRNGGKHTVIGLFIESCFSLLATADVMA